jgi:hypothetical protein
MLNDTRSKLFKLNKSCYWCGKDTILYEGMKSPLPPLWATIDHVYRVSDPRRSVVPGAFVLSCYSCNQVRAKQDEKAVKGMPPSTEKSFTAILEEQPHLIPTTPRSMSVKNTVVKVLFGLFSYKKTEKET